MKVIIQRVSSASVSVLGKSVGEIDNGLLVLVGVDENDSEEDAELLAEKIIKMRILSDLDNKMNLSLIDKRQKILAVSQFTLFADTKKGNRPSFIKTANPEKAEKLYDYFVKYLRGKGIEVATGKFGEYMDIKVNLDGPVTIIINSKD